MTSYRQIAATLLLGWTVTGHALAQDAPSAGIGACEIHLWPGAVYETGSTGWSDTFGPGIQGPVLDESAHLDSKMTTAAEFQKKFDLSQQSVLMKSFDFARFTHKTAVTIVENSSFDPKRTAKLETRSSTSTAPCYIEFYVLKSRYYYAPLPGKQFQTTFLIKDFRGGKPRIFRDLKITKIKLFPALEPSQERLAARELEQAFLNNLEHFAERALGQTGGGG